MMSPAALPTARIVSAQKKKTSVAPRKPPMNTLTVGQVDRDVQVSPVIFLTSSR